MVDFVAFNIILDDIVFPDGRSVMGELGGGGPQTAFGMRLWADSVGLVAGVGPDFPQVWWQQLNAWGIDLRGVRHLDVPSLRAWQLLEEDGRRTQVWRVAPQVIRAHFERRLDQMPEDYLQAKGFHLGVHPLEARGDFIEPLQSQGAVASIEPFKPAERRPSAEELRRLLSLATIFSPNLGEAISLLGQGSPESLLKQLLDGGTEVVALRLGDQGALLGRRGEEGAWHIPAVPVQVVDPTGAGNAFCGGFLVGWVQFEDLVEAGLRAVVSASFMVTQVGMPRMTMEDARALARERLSALRSKVRKVILK